jgi:hypothetical protein
MKYMSGWYSHPLISFIIIAYFLVLDLAVKDGLSPLSEVTGFPA